MNYPLTIRAKLKRGSVCAIPVENHIHIPEVIIDSSREYLLPALPREYASGIRVGSRTLASVLMQLPKGSRICPPPGRPAWDFRAEALMPQTFREGGQIPYEAFIGDEKQQKGLRKTLTPLFFHPATLEQMLYVAGLHVTKMHPDMKEALKNGDAKLFPVSSYLGPCVVVDASLANLPPRGWAYLLKDERSFNVTMPYNGSTTTLMKFVTAPDSPVMRRSASSCHDYRRSAFSSAYVDPDALSMRGIRPTSRGLYDVVIDGTVYAQDMAFREAIDYRDDLTAD